MTRSVLALLLASVLALAACTSEGSESRAAGEGPEQASTSTPPKPAATIATNLQQASGAVSVDEIVRVTADDGTLERVVVRGREGRIDGMIVNGGAAWKATDRLEPGVRYRVRAVAVDDQGRKTRHRSAFRTEQLPLERQTFPSIAPLDGETVGIGMPVLVQFDVPVTDRASIEKHLSVQSTPRQKGSWHWVSDQQVRWRPKTYWKPGTEVTVNADINSVPAGNGIYGQLSRSITFNVGDAVVSKVDVDAHRMKVFINGKLARTMPACR
jgi:hypothetical protein